MKKKAKRKIDEDYLIARYNPVQYVSTPNNWSIYKQIIHDREEDKMFRVWRIGKYERKQ